MNRYFLILFLVTYFGIPAAFAEDISKYVSFSIPVKGAAIEAIKNDRLPEDIELFLVKLNGKVLLKLYLGNAPQRLVPGKSEEHREQKFDRLTVGSLWKGSSLTSREVLVSLAEKGWPNYLHASFADSLSKADKMEADKLLSSLTFVNGRAGN
jgi:hypothetical protein